jgi:hypothetical protein
MDRRSWIVLLVFSLGLFVAPTAATSTDPVVYTGYDVGTTSLAASPNASAAAAAFDFSASPTSVIDFEGGLPAGIGLSPRNIVNTSFCATAALHCYATSGTRVQFQGGASPTFTFLVPIDSFGAYFTGWQSSNQTLTLRYADGTQVVLNMGPGHIAGGTRFFGFIDNGAAISSVTYNGLGDAVGIDDLRYRTSGADVPPPPRNLHAQVTGSSVTVNWTPSVSGSVSGYRLEAGSLAGLSDLASVNLGVVPSFLASGVPPGAYFVRVRAIGIHGLSGPSNEVLVTVTGGATCTAAPNSPINLTSSVNGTLVALTWQSGGGCASTNFALHAGTGPGLSNTAIVNLGAGLSLEALAPAGTYYVRVLAQNAFGSSAASNEVVVSVR